MKTSIYLIGEDALHGLIFVTWEQYLSQRFGPSLLHSYREAIGETLASAPLATRLYKDETLLVGVGAASTLTHVPAETLLREYGRYFIINGLTSHLCSQILSPVTCSRDLLLRMRDVHARLRRTDDGMTPPLFNYEISPQEDTVILLYDSHRQLCPVLWGALEGAAQRYHEQAVIQELNCMKKGDSICRFQVQFYPLQTDKKHLRTHEQVIRQQTQTELARGVLNTLPYDEQNGGLSLGDLQERLQQQNALPGHQLRPAILLEALQHLQFAGYVASTSNQPGDNLTNRRYWRVSIPWD